ncbi:iron complex outermembrane recepter protein [Robiginitalea myxolifaciens]|uniref:Iron complex outermembrane recepter protein n=1 Tax=Robiginitalea myxolifaciens TaxID=400055 RepID=A0A1I6GVH4_9FLAO|nr:TonB-dependent receptor [Robiginitalea myxolifaciens]SFR46263.1 iron complex outermembrane recepter protein [Robiginitalea myxolifaciens]
MRTLWVHLLVLLSANVVSAQQCDLVLSGKVLDFHDQSPLSGAVIEVTARDLYAQTDPLGSFTLKGLCPGVYELQVSHPECSTIFRVVEISEDSEIKISLEHHIEELEEVLVTGESDPNEVASQAEAVLNTETLREFSGASLGDALKRISGVNSINTGSNIVKPVIQGLYGSRVIVMNNEVRMQDMEWGEEHAPTVDINAADRVRVLKGSSALRYGSDAVGGIILMEGSLFPARDSIWGATQITGNTNGRGGTIGSEVNRTWDSGMYASVQGSYRRSGDLEAPDYLLTNTGTQQLGLSLEVGKRSFTSGWNVYYSYFDTDIAVLRSSHIGNVDDLIRSINSGEPEFIEPFSYDLAEPRQEVNHHLGKAEYFRRIEGVGKWEIQYDFQRNRRFEFDINRSSSDIGRPAIDLTLTTHTLQSFLTIDKFSGRKLEFGISGRYQDNFANPDTGVRRLIPDYDRYEAGAFGALEWELSPFWVFDGGMRLDFSRIDARKFYRTSRWNERGYQEDFGDIVVEDLGTQLLTNPVLDYTTFSVASGLSWIPDTQWTVGVNLSASQRAPNPAELFSDGLHHSAARIELGDLRIDKETSYKGAITANYNSQKLSAEVTPYYNYISDFILLEPEGVEFTIRGAFPVWNYRQTNAALLGLDVNINYEWTDMLSSQHQFSLVKGRDLDQDGPLINIPAANTRNAVQLELEELNNLRFGLESRYVFRQNETPENIIVFSPEQNQDVELEINTAPPAYHLMNFNAGLDFELSGKTTLAVNLRVQNLWNTSYRDYLNRLRYFADSPGRNWVLDLRINY